MQCTDATVRALVTSYKKEIDARLDEINTPDTLDWYSLTIGWAIAKGLTPRDASEFMEYIRLWEGTSHDPYAV